jgi:hypothetical protein
MPDTGANAPPIPSEQLAREFTALHYLTTSALVIWVWEALITLDDEVSLVWLSQKRIVAKTLYAVVSFFLTLL